MSDLWSFRNLVVGFSIVYLGLVLSPLLQPQHQLRNLEPYPDGLLYALSARNAATGGSLRLEYLDSTIKYWVPPLYSVTLVPGYLVSDQPQSFVIGNAVLGLSALLLLIWTIWKTTGSSVAAGVAGVVYLAHGYVFIVAGLPMAENASLLLFALALAALFVPREFSWKAAVLVVLASFGLVLTKYASVFVAGTLVLATGVRFWPKINRGTLLIGLGTLAVAAVLYGVFVSNPIALLGSVFGTSHFFSPDFALANLTGYLNGHVGQAAPFLWYFTPLTSLFLLMPAAYWMFACHASEAHPFRSRVVAALFLAQFPLLLIFYTTDTRYSIYTVPLLALVLGWLAAHILHQPWSRLTKRFALVGLSLLIAVHLLTQLPLYKEIIAANLLGRSTAWQQQSILSLDQELHSLQSANSNTVHYLITALPPFLYGAYAGELPYQILPLSVEQEFVAKGQWVWGSAGLEILNDSQETTFRNSTHLPDKTDVQTPPFTQDNLLALMLQLLEDGHSVYISNAYITHQASVIEHFEEIGNLFTLTDVSIGCEGVCNLYEVSLKDSSI